MNMTMKLKSSCVLSPSPTLRNKKVFFCIKFVIFLIIFLKTLKFSLDSM